jgi:hypothetical protein
MTTVMNEDIEDIQDAVRTGRVVRPHGPYRVQIGNERLEYRPAVIEDPVPTGLQILEAAEARPADEHLVFQVLNNGLLEELRPDETTDLRAKGVEKFLVFRNDRSFRFELDGRIFEWGGTFVSGLTLKKLAGVDPATYGVWLEVRGAEDRPIGNDELIDLSAVGVERFFTGIVQTTEGLGTPVLPMKCRRYLTERGIIFEEIEEGGKKAIVLRSFTLPPGRFNSSTADILILLPAGYPDNPPDMFYALPWLRLVASNGYPKAADYPIAFGGQTWQRWSRHNNAWRPGVDGIWTMVKRVETALREAA